MKTQLYNLVLACVALTFGAATFPAQQKPGTKKAFNVTIEQNGVQQKIAHNSVSLHPGAFDIVIELPEPMGLLVNASLSKKTYQLASQNAPLDQLPGFKETGMAEGLLNSDRDVAISDEAPNYWFYDTDKENRFNSVTKSGNSLICKRTIENIFEPRTETSTKISDVHKPIYLVFVSYESGEGITDRIEVQRQYIAIKWTK